MDRTKDGHLIIERTVIDASDGWELVICLLEDNNLHPFVVWNFANKTGVASSGTYCEHIDTAAEAYLARGGVFKSVFA